MFKAVITGDIIHSSQLSDYSKITLMDEVNEVLNSFGKKKIMRAEIYRGDSFQCLINQPKNALRIALSIKTYIRSLSDESVYDARLSIGIGKVDLVMKQLSLSNGEAFHISGRLIDEMKKHKKGISIASADNYNAELQMESILLDALLAKTSALQCKVINLKLNGHTEIQIANLLKITQSAVNYRSNSSNWNAIDAMVKRFENIYANE
jgi:hypothetical protein